MTPLMNKCLHKAEALHKDVTYGGGMVMLQQIEGTVALVSQNSKLTGQDKENAICAAYLHKCFEPKRIAEGVKPMTMEEVEKYANPQVRQIVEELASEPAEPETQTKMEQWQTKAEWSKTLSAAAQEILLAEKVLNFETSRDRPNPKKPLEWHLEYFQTRMLMVEALKNTNEKLYQRAVQTKNEGLKVISAMLKARNQTLQKD